MQPSCSIFVEVLVVLEFSAWAGDFLSSYQLGISPFQVWFPCPHFLQRGQRLSCWEVFRGSPLSLVRQGILVPSVFFLGWGGGDSRGWALLSPVPTSLGSSLQRNFALGFPFPRFSPSFGSRALFWRVLPLFGQLICLKQFQFWEVEGQVQSFP